MEVAQLPANGAGPAESEPSYDGQAEATRSTEELFQWSAFVHVGAGATECEHGRDGQCRDDKHFHAWVCLPNIFQMRDIGEKARAAKARKKRALRDPESDSYAILEDDLADIARDRYDELLDAVAKGNVEKELPSIAEELKDDERFEHQEQDAEELQRLTALPEEERDRETYERLQADVLAYGKAFEEIVDRRTAAERASLASRPREDVLEIERRSRVENVSAEVYLHTYYTWAMYVGTRVSGFSARRKFAEPEALKAAPPEVVTVLRETLRRLEDRTTVRSDAAGNS